MAWRMSVSLPPAINMRSTKQCLPLRKPIILTQAHRIRTNTRHSLLQQTAHYSRYGSRFLQFSWNSSHFVNDYKWDCKQILRIGVQTTITNGTANNGYERDCKYFVHCCSVDDSPSVRQVSQIRQIRQILCRYETFCGISRVQIQPKKHLQKHADYTASTRQHDLQ